MRVLLLAVLLCFFAASPAVAKHHSYHHSSVHYSDGRPSAWCGWQMRQWFGGGPEYNLAANWAHRGTATTPHIGAVVVWPHHVGFISGKAPNGVWIVKSGNDGHAVRERPRSLAGVIAVRSI